MVMMKYALKMEKGKCSSSECHLGEGNDHENKKCVSKVSLGYITTLESCEMEELL